MGNIMRLDEHLANMIAAGEVIERPANIVKELVENALDAKSSYLQIDLKESGMAGVSVTDNGTGMDGSDALLAFERHATSKIKNEPDLFRIRSLGFRGEALPSIAAIARVELTTSTGGLEGTRVVFQAGKHVSFGAAPARQGTTVAVSKIFYNTPARLKYLKGPVPELAAITELVDKFALAHPEVAFAVTNDGKEIFRTPGNGKILEVLGTIYGFGTAKMMKIFRLEGREYALSGVLTNPIVSRSSKSYVTLITNGRVIRNPRIVGAVLEAYDQMIPKGRYPIALLRIDCDPLLIDVNIHPTKQEIKFSEEGRLIALIIESLRGILKEFTAIPEISQPRSRDAAPVSEQIRMETPESEPMVSEREEASFIAESGPEASVPIEETPPPVPAQVLPDMQYVGQYAGTYLLFQNEDGLFLVDQHAAAERVRYERYLLKMGDPHPQFYDLLIPFNLDFSNHETFEIRQNLSKLAAFGIGLTPSGTQSFFLNSVPAWFPLGMEEIYAETVIRAVVEGKDPTVAEVRDELAKLLACKHSIKANRFINETEIATLMKDLRQCKSPYTCPHGRPVVVKIALRDIEKWFKRVM